MTVRLFFEVRRVVPRDASHVRKTQIEHCQCPILDIKVFSIVVNERKNAPRNIRYGYLFRAMRGELWPLLSCIGKSGDATMS
jgi:hypothetical protein